MDIDLQHGIKGIFISLVVLIIVNLSKGIWNFINRNMIPSRNEFISLTKALNEHKMYIDEQKANMQKISSDLHRVFLFLKVISGDNWKLYRKQVEEIEKENLT